MAKLSKDIIGCADGDIYPRTFFAGEDCPPELLQAATECGAVTSDQAQRVADEAAAVLKGKVEKTVV